LAPDAPSRLRRPPSSPLVPSRRSSDLGAALTQASSVGSNALQWEQLYQKNSMTSTLPAGASGATGLSSRLKSLPSLNWRACATRSEEHTSELQSRENLVCRLLLEKKKR